MRRIAFIALPAVLLVSLARPAHAEPAFGSNCLSCHSVLQTDKIVIFNEDIWADPDESSTGAPDRGSLPVFQANRGQTKTLEVRVQALSTDDTYAVQLSRLRFLGVENNGALSYAADCGWPEWGESAYYYTDPVISYRWGSGPTDFAFDIYVDPDTPPDYYNLLFAVGGVFSSDDGLFYARQHFYLQVLPSLMGDLNGDGNVDNADVTYFVSALLGTDPSRAALADMDGNRVADGRDIQLFVDTLLAAGQ